MTTATVQPFPPAGGAGPSGWSRAVVRAVGEPVVWHRLVTDALRDVVVAGPDAPPAAERLLALLGGHLSAGRADLLVVDGDPLKDIGIFQKPGSLAAIVKGGSFHRNALN